ncbi:MAG TPA: dolichyl-phosphate beta-glucosyltransferase [Candidatus Dormibacteraeota bacterium]|nr:dolichyl-phosphate beta-glucosyltransferase [Candidatus Dormibacteraeota bacterium]
MTDPSRPWLSVVIPAYNEERRLPPTLHLVAAHLRERGRPFEVVVADDGSQDATAALAGQAGPEVRVLRLPHRGKGGAVKAGVLAAAGELVLVTDADLSTPIVELDRLVAALDRCEVAIGSRHVAGSIVSVRQRLDRRVMGRAFNLLVQALLLPGLRDTQCGVKLFRRDVALAVFERCRADGFAFDVEALSLARRLGYRVAEVPVEWRNSPDSRVRPLLDVPRMFLELLAIRRRCREEMQVPGESLAT